jgi:predicted transcriptional regulator
MTEEECEVFDLLLLGHDPSDRSDLGIFLSRVRSPLSQVLLQLIEKGLVRRVESKNAATHLSVNPAAAWFLAPREERQPRPD